MSQIKIIHDCDPGHDDAVAILMEAVHPSIDLRAITVVAGNQTIEKTARNALNVASATGLCSGIPIAAGMSRPIVREPITAGEIHGSSGLDGPTFGEPSVSLSERHAVDLIIDLLMTSETGLTLVPTGPLSNIGMALRKEPKIAEKIDKIVLMGGSCQSGNVTPSAEFNIYADPEAAHIVFNCGRPIVMMGLDVTRKALATADEVALIKSLGNPQALLFAEMMEFFTMTQKKIYGLEAPPLHDPVTIAWLIDPSCVTLKPMRVDVELRGDLTYGRTSCASVGLGSTADSSSARPWDANALVAVDIDFRKFWDIVRGTFALYCE
jgi:ribosylpyrimidine nucleosidase